MKDLKVFASFNEELFKEITQLLTLENFRYGNGPFGRKNPKCLVHWEDFELIVHS